MPTLIFDWNQDAFFLGRFRFRLGVFDGGNTRVHLVSCNGKMGDMTKSEQS